MKKLIGILLLLLVVAAVVRAGFSNKAPSSGSGRPVVKIGANLPLTGNSSYIGNSVRESIELRLSEVSKDSKFEYRLIVEDNALRPEKSVSNINKLINIDHIDIAISTYPFLGNPVAETLARNEVISFLPNAADPYSAKVSKYNFIIMTSPERIAELMVKKLQKSQIRKVAMLYVIDAGAEIVAEAQKKEFEKGGVEITDLEFIPADASDLSTIAAKMETKNPDIYNLMLLSPAMEEFPRRMKEQQINKAITSVVTMGYSPNKELFEGMWYVDATYPEREFTVKFEKAYGHLPYEMDPFAYAAIDLIVGVYEKYDYKPTTSQVADDLLSIKNHSSAVGEISADTVGIFESNPSLRTIRNGKVEVLSETE